MTTVHNEAEAQIVLERLAEAGIRAWPSGPVRTVTRDIYVEDGDLARARAVLRDAESISEAELVQAEEADAAARAAQLAAGDPPGRSESSHPGTGRPREPAQTAPHRRTLWDRLLRRARKARRSP